jgi:hypothetical protein
MVLYQQKTNPAAMPGNAMKFAKVADIHANLEAFQAVLRNAREQQYTDYAFLGDFVGYCADPLEGRIMRSQSELRDTYEFTGFFMLVSTGATPGPREAGKFPKIQ